MTVGEKIKRIRLHRGMTQNELGLKSGLQNNCDVRIAQYESGSRMPKAPLIKKMAAALDVDPIVLSSQVPTSFEEVIQSLIWIDESKEVDAIYDCLKEHKKMKHKLDTGKISRREYLDWQISYASSPVR